MHLASGVAILTTLFTTSVVSIHDNRTLAAASIDSVHVQTQIRIGNVPILAVNLGGWLVAEHWMYPESLMWQGVNTSIANSGEYSTITMSPDPDLARSRLNDHHATFITEDDIGQIAALGLNTVRVPVGWWITGFDNHDPSNRREWEVYTKGTIVYLDRLIREWAVTHNIAVFLSFHAAKGSQNGRDHSSPSDPGHSHWSEYPENVANSIDVVTFLADRYRNDVAFLGIGLLNEPSGNTSETVLYEYYQNAYRAVRSTGNDCVLSVMPMLLKQTPDTMVGFMVPPEFLNVKIEWHKYFVWGFEHYSDEQIVNVGVMQEYRLQVDTWNNNSASLNKLFIGEWSLASPTNMRRNNPELFYRFVEEQLKVHNLAEAGWAFWAWKIVNVDSNLYGWSLRDLVRDDRIAQLLRNSL